MIMEYIQEDWLNLYLSEISSTECAEHNRIGAPLDWNADQKLAGDPNT